ncbi:MAG: FtsQ-type POTRA domain-containing protein [Bacteroidota bacterium]|nr:FtsQ-type POTRA domain-containing protein [Bacteroidota bacterium]
MNARATKDGRRSLVGPAGVTLMLAIACIATLAVLADQWHKHAVKVSVDVRGVHFLTDGEILKAAGVPDTAVLADIPLEQVRSRVERLALVRKALVFREPPSTLVVQVEERMPLALVVNAGECDRVVDEEGYVLPLAPSAVPQTLPIIHAGYAFTLPPPGRPVSHRRLREALGMLRAIRCCGLEFYHLFSEISLAGKKDFILYTIDGGIPIYLRDTDRLPAVMRAFRTCWQILAAERGVEKLAYIDLRYRDQIVVRWLDSYPYDQPVVVDTTSILPD